MSVLLLFWLMFESAHTKGPLKYVNLIFYLIRDQDFDMKDFFQHGEWKRYQWRYLRVITLIDAHFPPTVASSSSTRSIHTIANHHEISHYYNSCHMIWSHNHRLLEYDVTSTHRACNPSSPSREQRWCNWWGLQQSSRLVTVSSLSPILNYLSMEREQKESRQV